MPDPSENQQPDEASTEEATSVGDRGRHFREVASELWHQKPGSRVARPSNTPINAANIVDGLDRREIGFGMAAVALAIALAIIGYIYGKHSTDPQTHNAANFILISNLVFAGILALGVGLRRRALLGFGCFFFGLEQAFSYHDITVAFPFFVLGGWLIMRANRKQKATRLALDQRPGDASRGSQSLKLGATAKASKRYTPPKRSTAGRRR